MPNSSADDLMPWERQPGEPLKAYAGFQTYRDMPPATRSYRKACNSYYGTVRTGMYKQWANWCSRYVWVTRAAAWDAEQDRIQRESRVKAIKDMGERQAKQATLLQQKAIQRLQKMEPEELTPRLLLTYLIDATKLERLARGEPETITQENVRTVGANLTLTADDPKVDIDRVASILGILRDSGALVSATGEADDAEVDEVRAAPADA